MPEANSVRAKRVYSICNVNLANFYELDDEEKVDLIFKNSAPCSECSKIIKLLDIKKIVYSNSSNNNNFIIVKPQDYFSDYKTLGRKQIDYKINNTKNKLKKIII